jgi:hypothetical protein
MKKSFTSGASDNLFAQAATRDRRPDPLFCLAWASQRGRGRRPMPFRPAGLRDFCLRLPPSAPPLQSKPCPHIRLRCAMRRLLRRDGQRRRRGQRHRGSAPPPANRAPRHGASAQPPGPRRSATPWRFPYHQEAGAGRERLTPTRNARGGQRTRAGRAGGSASRNRAGIPDTCRAPPVLPRVPDAVRVPAKFPDGKESHADVVPAPPAPGGAFNFRQALA